MSKTFTHAELMESPSRERSIAQAQRTRERHATTKRDSYLVHRAAVKHSAMARNESAIEEYGVKGMRWGEKKTRKPRTVKVGSQESHFSKPSKPVRFRTAYGWAGGSRYGGK